VSILRDLKPEISTFGVSVYYLNGGSRARNPPFLPEK